MSASPKELIEQLSKLADYQKKADELQRVLDEQKLYLVIIPRADAASIETFEHLEDLVDRVKTMLGQEVQVYMFRGHRLGITRGPNRYLVGPGIERQPLFDDPGDDVDPDGWLVDTTTESLPIGPADPHTPPTLIPAG